ncbi:helix-turn-helix domain-containing protein [Jatrophihabitans endophyticus]|uniref:helix-turn-helix domain-containing protein n=1 Tax=Jatrophihabitans endophyticus TaxID=1206085 RepID=UPI00093249C1|nr:helix-turn-helix domain-containing protein [Jatrophihabitans endophyticus]
MPIAAQTTATGADSVRALRSAHEQFLASGTAPGVRDLVAASWRRSIAAGVDVDDPLPPITVADTELADYREAHPLARVFPLLYDVLGRAAEECDAVMAVGDAGGQLLWVCGRSAVLDRAERINFVEGARWDEMHAGTNAPGTALQLDTPVQIRAAEHFARPVQPWTCTAAPIHDPITQAIVGIVDVTGGEDLASPQTLAMVRAAARMAEAELGRLVVQTAGSGQRLWTPAAAVRVDGLGRPDCLVEMPGRTVRLSPRHSEILVILADHPDGMTGDQLAVELYAEDVSTSTMRAELTRLRSLLGGELLASRPYRLQREVACDWRTVHREIEAGRPAEALRHYRGPLLPHSDAPGVVERRRVLERRLRAVVLASGQVDLMAAWTRSRWGADDRDVWARQLDLAAEESPLRTIAAAEIRRLDRELGAGFGVR